jgi:predicted permease
MLVVAEVALAVVLLVGAGLFTGSFVRLVRVDPGFDYHNVLVLNAWPRMKPGEKYSDEYAARSRQFTVQLADALTRVPGVEMVGYVNGGVPLTGGWSRNTIELPGRGELKNDGDDLDVRYVSANYVQVLRLPLLRGRYLDADDRAGAILVAVINEAAAQRYWPGQDPIGKHFRMNSGKEDLTVVGVVGNIHHLGPEKPPRQEAYMPLVQQVHQGSGTIVARTVGDPMAVFPAAKAAVWSLNPEQRFTGDTFTLEQYMDRLIAQRRFNMAVLALFGVLGLVIAGVGIYGVMAYVVAQRTNEIGIRMALGATRADVVSLVLRRAGWLLLGGLAIGTLGAWYLSASVKTFLFQVQPNDVTIFAAAIGILAGAGLLASALPARRAATVDPLVALRSE